MIKFVDMFSGIGGFREGLTRAGGFECVGHCEIDKYANRSYNALFDTKGEWFIEDARKADPSTMPDFQLLCGGFPCQSFSVAGARRGFSDPRGTLFFEIARLVEARHPAYLILENVPGLLSHSRGETYATILNTLDRLGYGVEWQCLNSKDFGVPQSRNRVYIIGYLDERCRGKVFPFLETAGGSLIQTHGGHQGERVYSPEGLSCTLAANPGGFGGKTGLLYGAYWLLMALASGSALPEDHSSAPQYALRMINCWDNADGNVERGYSGRSLFFQGGKLTYDPARMRQLGRMLASVGLNVLCINNVNVHDPAQLLIEDDLPDLAKLAAIFRPFGVRLMVSIDYSQPMRHGIPTADPLDERVQAWWKHQAEVVYAAIPDLAGFLVKADSEHRPGPFTYGRNHAEGANMLARALKPFGGMLVWRCFVYNCQQDWRDEKTDRPKAAYEHYVYLDGQFDDNVILQVKNGPFDFQVREPISPTLLAMPKTKLALEWQLAQEYTGQQIDIFAMPVMWQELFADMPRNSIMAMAAVSNLGNDACMTGHPFAALNFFAYGALAWDPDACQPDDIIHRWIRLTYRFAPDDENALADVLLGSRHAYEQYTAPLGICWMVTPNQHYGPSPDGYEYQAWGTYHKADRNAIGIDRTADGTGYVLQYPEALRRRFESTQTCQDELLLFFHRLPYTFKMRDGRTLIQRIYDDHFEGYEWVERAASILKALPLPDFDRALVDERIGRQLHNAREWRDIINTFFHRLSGIEDVHERKIYR